MSPLCQIEIGHSRMNYGTLVLHRLYIGDTSLQTRQRTETMTVSGLYRARKCEVSTLALLLVKASKGDMTLPWATYA